MRHICTDVPMFAVTVKGERFHKLTCKHVKKKQITRMTETELVQLKLTACKDCFPGTDEAGINLKMNSKLAMKPTNQRSKASAKQKAKCKSQIVALWETSSKKKEASPPRSSSSCTACSGC